MTHRVHIVYKKRYKDYLPENRINRMANSCYNIKKLEDGESTVFENTLVEKPISITHEMTKFIISMLAASISKTKNQNYSMSYSSFIDDYLDFLPTSNDNSNKHSSQYVCVSMPIGHIEMVEKEMEFEHELSENYLLLSLGNFKISPLCEINNEILNLLTERYVSFYLEEHDGVVKPFYNIHLKNESFVSDFSIKTGSLDFKNDDLFINSLIKMLNNYKITGFTFDEVKQAPLEHLQMIELLKY